MSKYTAEQFEDEARDVENGCAGIGWERRAKMLRYAAHLARQSEWPSDEDVKNANAAYKAKQQELHDIDDWKPWYDCEDAAMRAALQSVRPPAGVVSDEDVEMVCAKIFNGWPDVFAPNHIRMDVRAALESYASRHAPTKD